MKIAKFVLLTVLAFLFSGQVYAQQVESNVNPPAANSSTPDPDAMQAALELIKVSRSDDMIKQMLPILSKNFVSILTRDNPQKADTINQLMDKYFIPIFLQHLGEFQAQVAIIYTNNLSIDDMKQLTAFYQSPIGQKFLQVTPAMTAQIMPVAKNWSQQVSREAIQKLVEQLKQNNMNVPKEMGL